MSLKVKPSRALTLPLNPLTSTLPPAALSPPSLQFVSDERAITAFGNGLRVSTFLAHESDNVDDFIQSDTGRGCSAFAYVPKEKRLAFSPRSLNPVIHVVQYPYTKAGAADHSEDDVCVLRDGATISYASLSFSRCGSRLAGVSGMADFKLIVWQIDSLDKVVALSQAAKGLRRDGQVLATLELSEEFSSVEINPGNFDQFLLASTSKKSVHVLKLSKLLDKYEFETVVIALPAFHTSIGAVISKCTWITDSHVLVGDTFGAVHCFDGASGRFLYTEGGPEIPLEEDEPLPTTDPTPFTQVVSPVVAIIQTVTHFIIGHQNGLLLWRNAITRGNNNVPAMGSLVKQVAHLFNEDVADFNDPNFDRDDDLELLMLCSVPLDFHRIVALGSNGTVSECQIDVDVVEPKPDEEQQLDEDGNPVNAAPLDAEENRAKEDEYETVDFTPISNSHVGPVAAMTTVSLSGKKGFSALCTGGIDGQVMIWKESSYEKQRPTVVASVRFNHAVTSMECIRGFPVVAVGTADGCLRIIHLAARSDGKSSVKVTTLYREKICTEAITTMSFDPRSRRLAVGVFSLGLGFVVNVDPARSKFAIVGQVKCGDGKNISSFLWQNNNQLFVASSCGNLACVDTSSMLLPSTGDTSINLAPHEWSCTVSGLRNILGVDQSSKIGTDRFFYTVGAGFKGVQTFAVPDGMFSSESPVITSVCNTDFGQKTPTTIMCSPSGGLIASGGGGGGIAIYKVREGGADFLSSNQLHAGPVLCLTFSPDSTRIYSAAADGSVFLSVIENALPFDPIPSGPEFDFKATECAAIDFEPKFEDNVEATWMDKNAKASKARGEAEAKAAQAQALERVRALSTKLSELLQNNATCPELERMDRSEFVIDLQGREAALEKNKEAAAAARAAIKFEDQRKDMVACRVRQECWDSMATHACSLRALAIANLDVANFPIRKLTAQDQRKLDLVKRFRITEIAEMKRKGSLDQKSLNCWSGLTNEASSNIRWMVNAGFLRPTASTVEIVEQRSTFNEEEKKEEGEKDDDEDDVKASDITEQSGIASFLYPPLALRTPAQKRSQIVLLNELVRQIAIEFNKHFDKLKSEKDDCVAQIEGRNDRIREILKELKSAEDCFRPQISEKEIADAVLQINDSELKNQVYESNASKAARLKKEEEARIAAENNKGDNPAERALDDMMNGTLEVKKEAITTATLVKEAWMTEIPLKDMSEDQKKKLEEFNSQVKAIADALEKQKKALELELKKLKSEVSELVKAFDEKFVKLSDFRSAVQVVIGTQELYLMRCALSVSQAEDSNIVLTELEDKLAGLQSHRDILSGFLAAFSTKKEQQEDIMSQLNTELGNKERNFRKDIQEVSNIPLDQDTVKVLLSLYKKKTGSTINNSGTTSYSGNRGSGGQSSNRQSANRTSINARGGSVSTRRKSASARKSFNSRDEGGDLGPLQAAMKLAQQLASKTHWSSQKDPFTSLDEKGGGNSSSAKYEPEVVKETPLNADDFPESLPIQKYEFVIEKLQDLRSDRYKLELKINFQSRMLKEATTHWERARDRLVAVEQDIDELSEQIDLLREREKADKKDIEVMTCFKQGQDEVEQGAIATDYSKALLLPMSIITNTNKEIRTLGDEKVRVLNKTKNFRKHINFMNWEHEHLEFQQHDMDEHYTDMQLLRVTKQLKMVISGAKTDSDRVKAERAELHLSKLKSMHAKKVEKLEEANEKVMAAIKERQTENSKIDKQIADLEGNVAIREQIYKSRIESGGGSVDPGARAGSLMKRITMRRKLIDLARTQTDEIEFLRQELDRLREKTFPSFARAARDRLPVQPDEYE